MEVVIMKAKDLKKENQRLRGGLESDKPIPGLTAQSLMAEIDQQTESNEATQWWRDYLAYRQRAIKWSGKKKKLLPEEMDDPRFFEMRACGFDPYDKTIDYKTDIEFTMRKWFFGEFKTRWGLLGDNERYQLVMDSRRMRVRYRSPYQTSISA